MLAPARQETFARLRIAAEFPPRLAESNKHGLYFSFLRFSIVNILTAIT
jgi:hypothetical protein